jgi:hypothetical protein
MTNPSTLRRLLSPIGLLLVAAVLPSCSSGPKPEDQPQPAVPALPAMTADQVNPVALQADVNAFAFAFHTHVSSTATEMARATTSRSARESAIRWKIQVIPAMEAARLVIDPRVGLAGAWAICVRQRVLFDGPFGEETFADQAPVARRLAADLEKQAVDLASLYLPPERIAEVSDQLEQLAAEAPMIMGGFNIAAIVKRPARPDASDPLGQVLQIPLMPFAVIGAIGDTPAEIRNITNVAAGFGETARAMPELARWQLELLLLQSEDHAAVKDFGRLTAAVDSFAQTAKALTESLEQEGGPASELKLTVQEARALATQVDATAARAEEIVASIDDQAAAISQTAAAFESTIHAGQTLLDTWVEANPPKPASETPEQSDLEQATAAADHARAALTEARALLADLQTSSFKNRLDEINAASKVSIDHAADRLNGAINRLVWSLGAVIVLGIIVATAARRLTTASHPSRAAPIPS